MTEPRIEVSTNGPYAVCGLPVVRARMIEQDGHPVEWEEYADVDLADQVDDDGNVWLCRCGHSANKPFCDGTHQQVGFDGTETASHETYRQRAKTYDGVGIQMRDDRGLCAHAGFCTTSSTNAWKLTKDTEDPQVRQRLATMVDHCPSGALTHRASVEAPDDEQPQQPRVRVVDDGELAVLGGVPVQRSDGTAAEVRARVALCRCGESDNKPFCDGSHADTGFSDRGGS